MAYAVKDTHDAAEVDIPDSIHFPDIRLTMLCTGGELCIHRALPERDDTAGCRQLRPLARQQSVVGARVAVHRADFRGRVLLRRARHLQGTGIRWHTDANRPR